MWPCNRITMFIIALTAILASATATGESKAACQQQIIDACKKSCFSCRHFHYITTVEGLDEPVKWSDLVMICTVDELKLFMEDEKCMLFDPAAGDTPMMPNIQPVDMVQEVMELAAEMKDESTTEDGNTDEGVKLKRRAFTRFQLTIQDRDVKELKTNCQSDSVRKIKCLSNKLKGTLEHVTKLTVHGGSVFKHFGRVDDPVMQLFPNLRYLEFTTKAETFDITLIEMYYLTEFVITAKKAVVKLHCAFKGDNCLANPAGLKKLQLTFKQATGRLELYGKLRLPRVIDTLDINCADERLPERSNIGSNSTAPIVSRREIIDDTIDDLLEPEERQSHIFSNIAFTNVLINFFEYEGDIEALLNEFKLPTIENSFALKMYVNDIDNYLLKLYSMEIEDKLNIEIDASDVGSVYNIPFVDLKNIEFDQTRFSDCHYGQLLLSKRGVEKDLEGDILIRGYHMTLSNIVKLATTSPDYADANVIKAYVYSIDVDRSLEDLVDEEKQLKIYYVIIGTTGEPGLKEFYVEEDIKVIHTGIFPVDLIHLRNCKSPDPVFMRALATCLMSNIGEYDKTSPSKLMESNQDLSKMYTLIEQTREYPQARYTQLDIARTQSAYKFLNEYIIQRENQIVDVAKVPFVSLHVLTQNAHILVGVGRDLRDKVRHLDTLDSIDELASKHGEGLKTALSAISDSKVGILKASSSKSTSLAEIEKTKQKDFVEQIDNSKALVDHLTKKFDEYATEVIMETNNFKSGVKLAMGLAYAEAAAEAVNSILSIFTGGFNPVRALKAAKTAARLGQVIKKLMGILKKIFDLLKKRNLMKTMFNKIRSGVKNKLTKISGFFTRQKRVLSDWLKRKDTVLGELEAKDIAKLQSFTEKIKTGMKELESTKDMVSNTVDFLKAERTIRMGYDPGNPTEEVTVEGAEKIATVEETVKQFKDRLAKEASDEGNKLSAIDVFKWTIAKEHVTGMLDTTLSDDVPEATNYRTALLKLITTGQARTQASLDKAALETKYSASTHAWGLYFQEALSTSMEVIETVSDLNKAKDHIDIGIDVGNYAKKMRTTVELDTQWEILAIKFEMVRLNEEYCNSYYYFHLEKCKEDLRISPSNTLDEILNIQNTLMYQSNQKLNDLYPPPQTFTDKTITIKKPKHCKCLEPYKAMTTTEATTEEERNTQIEQVYESTKACLVDDQFVYPTGTASDGENEITNEVMSKCTDNNYVQNVIDSGELIYVIDIDSKAFDHYERVRVDEVKIIFKGVETTNNVIEVVAESTGASEDKFKGSCYKFLSVPWKRSISYSSSSNKINFVNSGDVHKSFSGLFRSPTVFSTWIFRIPASRNPGLVLTGLEEIELKFSGSFVTGPGSAPLTCNRENENDDDGNDEDVHGEGDDNNEDVVDDGSRKKLKSKSQRSHNQRKIKENFYKQLKKKQSNKN